MAAQQEERKRRGKLVGIYVSEVGQKRKGLCLCNQGRRDWTAKGGSTLELLCHQLVVSQRIEDRLFLTQGMILREKGEIHGW